MVSDLRNHNYLLLFSVPFLFYQCLILNVGIRIALHIREMDKLRI